jgi:hypothetical protein
MFEVAFRNKFLERMLRLTEKDEIKWKETDTIARHCKRWLGIGANHKFVIAKYDRANIDYEADDYIGYVNKYITDVENSWEFVMDRFSEIEDFIYIMVNMIEAKENGQEDLTSKPLERVDIMDLEFKNILTNTSEDIEKRATLEKVKKYYREYLSETNNEAELLKQKDHILKWIEVSKNNVFMRSYHEESLKIVDEKLKKIA